jgi:hypothetical protein
MLDLAAYVVGLGFIWFDCQFSMRSTFEIGSHTFRFPPVIVTLTNRRVYTMRL